MCVCMHVCMVVIPVIQNYMKTFGKCKQAPTHRHTNATFTVSSSFNMDSGSENTVLEKRQSKLDDEEKHRKHRERKMVKKEITMCRR